MQTAQTIVVAAAAAGVLAAYVRWIAARVRHPRGRLAPDQNMFMLVAPIGLAAIVVGLALASWHAGLLFGTLALMARSLASQIAGEVRAWTLGRPVKPEDRQRRFEVREARRRARARAFERYGWTTTTGRPEGRPEDVN
jgi:ABC-type transport system involved in cytochrome c biogenesis permease subunit